MLSLAIIFSLVVMISFGISNALSKEIAEKFGVIAGIVFLNIFVVPLLALGMFVLRAPFFFDLQYLGIGILIAFAGYLGFVCFMLALKNGRVGVVIPVASAQIIVASIFGSIFLGDELDTLKIATVSTVFIGVVLASVNFRDLRNSDLFSLKSGIPYALLTALIWGIALPLMKFPSEHLGSLFYGLVIEVVVLGSALLQSLGSHGLWGLRELYKKPGRRTMFIVVAATVFTALGTVFTNLAYQTGEISIVSAIRSSSSIVSLLVGAIIYREVLSKQQYLGALIVSAGILLPVILL